MTHDEANAAVDRYIDQLKTEAEDRGFDQYPWKCGALRVMLQFALRDPEAAAYYITNREPIGAPAQGETL